MTIPATPLELLRFILDEATVDVGLDCGEDVWQAPLAVLLTRVIAAARRHRRLAAIRLPSIPHGLHVDTITTADRGRPRGPVRTRGAKEFS